MHIMQIKIWYLWQMVLEVGQIKVLILDFIQNNYAESKNNK